MKPKKYLPMTNLQWLRIQAGMTQKDLAEAIGVSYIQISHYETGRSRPRKKFLQRIAAALKVSVEDISER